jgi:hypothetical protein
MAPDKITQIQVNLAAVAALSGLALAVGVQRKYDPEALRDATARDIYCTTRISPDGERINGSWVAAKIEDQEIVDLAQTVHSAFATSIQLPPLARQVLIRCCHDLEERLAAKQDKGKETLNREIDLLRRRLSAVRVSLVDGIVGSDLSGPPLSEQERASLRKLIESVIHPLCVWEKNKLRELFHESDTNLHRARL